MLRAGFYRESNVDAVYWVDGLRKELMLNPEMTLARVNAREGLTMTDPGLAYNYVQVVEPGTIEAGLRANRIAVGLAIVALILTIYLLRRA